MIVANYVNIKPEQAHSRTYEDFYKLLGTAPKMMGVMARMNVNNTSTFLTEGLSNVFYNEKTVNKFQPIDSLQVEWSIEVDFIKRVEFAAVPSDKGELGSEIVMHFKERYFERYDTFVIEKSGQQCIVKSIPQRKADDFWEYVVQLIGNDYEAVLDLSACQVGDTTRFVTNIQPEYHTEGYVKYQSNIEKHRTWIQEIRVDVSMSSRYDALEDQFIKIAKGDGAGSMKEKLFKLNKVEKDLLDSYATAKNNASLLGKTTMDANGKCFVMNDKGQPLIAGDGIIPQYERFAHKMKYARLDISVINTVMSQMADRCENPTGNTWVFAVNKILWSQINTSLMRWLANWDSAATMLYSKAAGGMVKADNPVKVGATFTSYEIMGNTVSFVVDNAISLHYRDKGWGICMDLTPDMSAGDPAISGFTLRGKEFTSNKLTGVGFKDGEVATPVAGGKLIVSGYSGMAVFAPYKAFILSEN